MRCIFYCTEGDTPCGSILPPNSRKALTALPLKTYQAGETVLANGSRTNELLILKNGSVAVVRQGIEVARVTDPGAVFGEISALLDCPHTADVRAVTTSQFHVAHPAALQDPAALFYVAAILARRLDRTNQALVELTNQVEVGEPRSAIASTIEKMKRLLVASGAALGHVGYSYNRFA